MCWIDFLIPVWILGDLLKRLYQVNSRRVGNLLPTRWFCEPYQQPLDFMIICYTIIMDHRNRANMSSSNILHRHRLTLTQYHKMGESGIFGVGERVELIEGELIDMAPIKSWHAGTLELLREMIREAWRGPALVFSQNPLTLSEHSEPEPDIMVLRHRADYYRESHPSAEDVLLVVELSDTTLRYDREVKIPLYARYGIPQVWIVNHSDKRLEVYRESQSEHDSYRHLDLYYDGRFMPLDLDCDALNLAGIF